MAHPVFFDPHRKRWKRLRLALNIAGVITTFFIVFFTISIVRGTTLPDVGLPAAKHPYKAIKEAARRHYPRKAVTHRKTGTAPSKVVLNTDEGIRAAFYVTWDAGSFASLKEYAHQIDLLFPEWLHVLTPDGRLQAVSQDNQLFPVILERGPVSSPDPAVMAFLKSEKLQMEVLPLVNNFDPVRNDWMGNIADLLDKPPARAAFRRQVALFLASDNYRGLTLDFEGFPFASQPGYRALISELADDLHAKGMKLYVAVPARNEDYDFSFIAQHSDGAIVMNYDQHYPDGPSGPVASQDWFVQNLERALKLMPRDKIICAIANYGYDWTAARKGHPAEARIDSVQQAWLDSHDSEADIEFDSDSMNPHFSYLDEANARHDVWFVDGVTALNQMRAANRLGINTFALWRLGSEDRSLWKIWDNPGEPSAPDALREVQPGHDVDHEGTGEVMRIEQHPIPGQRSIVFDKDTGLIEDETFDAVPLPYQVAHYGGGKANQIALTFDDGPDPEWTPKILDILKQQNAPATFFVIGKEAEDNPGLLKRIYREGHEIGNHTWSHPDISGINRAAMRIELNATERLFESKLGVKPIYFRPPYSIDQDPDTDDQVRPLDVMQELGYIAVGAKLDPNDWQDNPRRTAEEILSDPKVGILNHLPPCRPDDLQKCGNIILLHDGGGNRQETVRALPLIIQALRARGFQIVPVSTLLGKTRIEVMPNISPNERWSAWVGSVGFTALGTIGEIIALIFFVGDALMTLRLFLVGAFAMYDRFHQRHDKEFADAAHFQPDVAVLIPAFNEETVIAQTVRAVLASDYPRLRVIVVDDGSTDHTLEAVQRGFAAEEAAGRVMVLTKPNAGKAEALNFGLKFVTEDIFIGIDADTEIAPKAISRLVPHFLDQRVGAVAGNAKVGNRVNIWTRWQALEYITSQNFERRALNTLGSVTVVPGALGAWRTSAVRDAGGYHVDTVAEDADLTMALLRAGYCVQYEDRALAYTEAPISARGLMRQRFRWSFGILQSLWKHREVFARKGVLGLVALPNILIFQILLPLVSPFIDIMFVVGVASYLLDRYFHPQTADKSSVEKLLLFFLAFLIIDFVTSAVAFALERRDEASREDGLLLFDVWLQRFVYRQLFSVVLFRTLKRALEGKHFAWDKLERTAGLPYARVEP